MSSNTDAGTIRDALLRRASVLGLMGALVAIGMSLTFVSLAQASPPRGWRVGPLAGRSGHRGTFEGPFSRASVRPSFSGPYQFAGPGCAGAAVSVPCPQARGSVEPLIIGGGQITGKVTDATTTLPVKGIDVCAYKDSNGEFFEKCTTEPTDANGEYVISELVTGEYVVVFFSPSGNPDYITQYYGSQVQVTAPNPTPDIDVALQEGASISGKVTDASTTDPIENIEVCVFTGTGHFYEGCVATNKSGEYKVTGLSEGKYVVEFFVPSESALDYAPQFYKDVSSASEATQLTLAAGQEGSGIDAALHGGGHITGRVTAAGSNTAIEGVEVCVYAEEYFAERCAITGTNGEYTVTGLGKGQYYVYFFVPFENTSLDYAPQFYDKETSFEEAETVTVAVGKTTSGVNASMEKGGDIAGTVTAAATGAAIDGIEVCAYAQVFSGERCATTNANGEYTITSLGTGGYVVEFFVPFASGLKYEFQYYNGKNEKESPNLVSVTAGQKVSGIDATMHEPGEKPKSGGGSSSSSSSSGGIPPAAQGGTGVEASVATKSPQVTVGTIKSKSGAVYASLHCGATTGICPAATVELTVVEQLHNGHVTAVTAGHGSKTTKRKVVVIGEVKVTLGAGQSKTVKVSLNSTGRKLIAQHKKLPVEALVLGEGATLKALKLKLTLPPKKKR